MKRIVSAALLAIIFHLALFAINFGQFFDDTVTPPGLTAVTVTMSYRKPEPVVEQRKKQLVQPEVRPKKKPKTPEKKPIVPPDVSEDVLVEPVNVPETPEAEPTQEPEETADFDKDESVTETADEAEFQEDSHGDDVANMQVVQEAVPLYRKNPPPYYPGTARRRGYQGIVMLSVLVNEKGRVENLWVAESSGYRILDNSAIKAVRDWAFEPATKANKKVVMWVNVPIRFQLE